MVYQIPFNKPFTTGNEIEYIRDVISSQHHSGDGKYTNYSTQLLSSSLKGAEVLLTPSCTAALEMCALLIDIQQGDEVIMPSYTFVSTANAFVLRGATIKFVDISLTTLCIDLDSILSHITPHTKAIVAVHYAGISCDISALSELCKVHDIFLIEDAAQSINSFFNNIPLGTFGDLSTFSFHETKNISSGEGGALVINNQSLCDRAHIIREKGTNRRLFFKGLVDKYGWFDIGSSYLMNEITAAYLYAQLLDLNTITNARLRAWNTYNLYFSQFEQHHFRTSSIPAYCRHNAHIFYLIFNEPNRRDAFISFMKERSILCPFHYLPLHTSPYFQSRNSPPNLPNTDLIAKSIVRLPLWPHIGDQQHSVLQATSEFIEYL